MSEFLLNLVLAALPAAALIAWVLLRDRARPEPPGAVLKAVAFGLLAAVPAIAIEPFVDLPSGSFPWPLDAAVPGDGGVPRDSGVHRDANVADRLDAGVH